jgi:hypothetical protein
MAKFQAELPDDVLKDFQKIYRETDKIFGGMTQAAAKVVESNIRANMKNAFKDSSSLEKHLKVTKVYHTPSDSGINTKVAFYGYLKNGKKFVVRKKGKDYDYSEKGVPVPLIVRAREFGSRSGERKKPFVRPAFKESQIKKTMLQAQKELSGGLLNE